jgi:DNA-binding MarR family transcriptional regulator
MAGPDPTRPTDACTAAKVRRLARRVTQIYDDALAPHGLTIGQMSLLASLSRRQGIGIAALAQRLGADPSTVSRLVRPLESMALIAIAPDPDDGRTRLVTLTDAGAERRRAAGAAWSAAQAEMATRLGEGRLAALRFLLDDAHDRLAETMQLQEFS